MAYKLVILVCISLALSGCYYSSPYYREDTFAIVWPTNSQAVGYSPLTPQLQDQNVYWTSIAFTTLPSFRPVPLGKLANYCSLKKKQTNAEFQEAYAMALEIVTPLAGLPREQQLIGIAQALRAKFDASGVYSTSAKHYNDPYGYFILGIASCAGCARATGLCLNILGIPYEHVNENEWLHQWCRVNINGVYWICDAFGIYVGPEPGPYQHPIL